MSDTPNKLRGTTEEMAVMCTVRMSLWNSHSNLCLSAANEIESLETELTAAQLRFAEAAAWAKKANDDLAAERAKVAELSKDRERMEWAIEYYVEVFYAVRGLNWTADNARNVDLWRAAIDAAIAKASTGGATP